MVKLKDCRLHKAADAEEAKDYREQEIKTLKMKVFNRGICGCALLVTNPFVPRKQRRNEEIMIRRKVIPQNIQLQEQSKCRRVFSNKKMAVLLCTIIACAGIMLTGITVSAGETGEFRSRGAIRYRDAGGQEVILDAQDINVLFQYAAEGKSGLSQALGGVGTKLVKEGQGYYYTRDPKAQASIVQIQTTAQMQEISFDLLLQALAESQTLPEGYEGTYTLACSDNMTLGRAAWSDGSLMRGNNHDLIEHYLRGWLEGRGCTDYEAVYDEEGRWIGYREKQS